MKILVVGGAGYIGSHTVYELVAQGQEVIVFDNLSTGYRQFVPQGVTFYQGDIRHYDELADCVTQAGTIDCVMHFAAKIVVPESVEKPLEYYSNNVEGVRVLLEIIRDFKIPHLIFSSSAATYGENKTGVFKEKDALRPISPYGETKVIDERMIAWASQAYGFSYLCFRYFNVAGAHPSLEIGLKKDQITHLIPLCIKAGLGQIPSLQIFGNDYPTPDGTCIRDYIHVCDLAKAHILGIKYLASGKSSTIFNLGSGKGYSVQEVISLAQSIIPFTAVLAPRRAGDPAKLIAQTVRARKELKFKPQYSLEAMIKSDLAFRQKWQ
jgi:UDP-glucose 4-epimerase